MLTSDGGTSARKTREALKAQRDLPQDSGNLVFYLSINVVFNLKLKEKQNKLENC